MKKIFAVMAFALAPMLVQASPLFEEGCGLGFTSASTTVFSGAITGTASSSYDLDGYAGVQATLQVPSGSNNSRISIRVYWSADDSVFLDGETIRPGSVCLPARARYVKFQVLGFTSESQAATFLIRYLLPPSGSSTAPSTVTVSSGSITLDGGETAVEPPVYTGSSFIQVFDTAVRLSANAGAYDAADNYSVWVSCAGDCLWDWVWPDVATATAQTMYSGYAFAGVTFSATAGIAGPVVVPQGTGIVAWGTSGTITARVLEP